MISNSINNEDEQEQIKQIKMVEHYLSINDDIFLKNDDVKINIYSKNIEYICGQYLYFIKHVCKTTNRSDSILQFTVNIFKRFISSIEDKDIIKYYDDNNVKIRGQLMLFVCSSLLISSKYDEVYPISISQLLNTIFKKRRQFFKSEINELKNAESYILKSIKFELFDLCKY